MRPGCIVKGDTLYRVYFYFTLPDSVVDADTLNTFKSRLDKHWLDQDVLYNFHSELTGNGGASICM